MVLYAPPPLSNANIKSCFLLDCHLLGFWKAFTHRRQNASTYRGLMEEQLTTLTFSQEKEKWRQNLVNIFVQRCGCSNSWRHACAHTQIHVHTVSSMQDKQWGSEVMDKRTNTPLEPEKQRCREGRGWPEGMRELSTTSDLQLFPQTKSSLSIYSTSAFAQPVPFYFLSFRQITLMCGSF